MPDIFTALFLLQRLRDEAHRFAITLHRDRRSKSMVDSVLDSIDGLGPARKKSLLKAFGSLKRLKEASVDDISAVEGFGPALAQSVHAQLQGTPKGISVNMTTGEIIDS